MTSHTPWSQNEVEKTSKEEQAEQLKALFASYDTDGSGSLNREEMAVVFKETGGAWNEEDLGKMFDIVDADGSGTVCYAEYVDWLLDSSDSSEGEEDEQLPDPPKAAIRRSQRQSLLVAKDCIEIRFELDYYAIDHDKFKADLTQNFVVLGLSKADADSLIIKLRAGSTIAAIYGDVNTLANLRKLDLRKLNVMGATCNPVSPEGCGYPASPPARHTILPPAGSVPTENVEKQLRLALLKCFVFASLTEETLATVVAAMKLREVSAGSTVVDGQVTEGDDRIAAFVSMTGRLQALDCKKNSPTSMYVVPWQYFCDTSLLCKTTQYERIEAKTDAKIWAIDVGTFKKLLVEPWKQVRKNQMRLVGKVAILADLSTDAKRTIADTSRATYFTAGTNIVKEGEENTNFYIVEQGKCKALHQGNTLFTYGPSSYFGELAFLNKAARTADVVAAEDTRLLVLNAKPLSTILKRLHAMKDKSALDQIQSQRKTEDGDSDGDSADEDDEIDDEAYEKTLTSHLRRIRTNGFIVGRASTMPEGWTPPRIEKTADQQAMIKASLASHFMFAAVDSTSLETVILAFQQRLAGKDEVLVEEGDAAVGSDPAIFVLEDGHLQSHKTGVDGAMCSYDKRGDCVVDLGLVHDWPRPQTVKAVEASRLWSLDRATYHALVKNSWQEAAERVRKFLDHVPLLRGLREDEMTRLCSIIQRRTYSQGDRVVKQFEKGSEFYIVEAGGCEARRNDVALMQYSVGAYFGELILLSEAPRDADVFVTEVGTKLLVIDMDAFNRVLCVSKVRVTHRVT
eukprot:TRINITY_DN21078_c0_g1_i2.p1 TRINITY_DN21078_c0_g1~~TRINITY_DN21078_c0_g1_i2.p1  ORF type:complete len:796 (+),score=160.46 TRINITY_DN21078_c0_g1_i2:83-2470(+)